MNSQDIARELERTLLRYRAGLIPLKQAREELALLQALLKAQEQAILEQKLDRITEAMEVRQHGN